MTIWILVLVLLASLAALGYRQGAIRASFSLLGIIVAAMLAVPLAPLLKPLMPILGVKNLLLAWALPPFIIFVLINSAFKVGALPLHRKVEVYYKYKAGDLRSALFERLNARLGLCLGLVNGTIYVVLISFVIYVFGYWTVQLATSEEDPWTVRFFNRVAHDLQDTGLARVAKAVDPLPDSYYDAADFVGLIYHNPLLEGRLARYPALLELGERTEFQQLAKDISFTDLRQRRASFREVMNHSQANAILKNNELLQLIWSIVDPNMQDLMAYLNTGKSAKYDRERILGCWSFDFNGAFTLYRRANSKLSVLQLREVRKWMSGLFLNTTLVAGTEGFVVVKSLPRIKPPRPGEPAQGPESKTLTGKWKARGTDYELQFDEDGAKVNLEAKVEGNRLTVTGESLPLVLDRDL